MSSFNSCLVEHDFFITSGPGASASELVAGGLVVCISSQVKSHNFRVKVSK